MSKKVIIISIIAILLIAAGVIGVLYFTKNASVKQSVVKKPTSEVTVPDISANYGACDLVSVDEIKSALGDSAKSLYAGFNTGKGEAGRGDLAQNCIYGFTKQVSNISTDALNNSFFTTVYVFKDQANKTATSKGFDSSTPIDGIGDKANFYTDVDSVQKTTSYNVRVESSLRYFVYTIQQSTASKTFDATTAQTALTTLAKSVNYSKFANKS